MYLPFSVIAQIKNEARRLPHWLDYYSKFGCDFFIACDNPSDGSEELLKSVSSKYDITVISTGSKEDIYTENPNIYGDKKLWLRILDSYDRLFDLVVEKHGRSRWMLPCDPDEFLVVKNPFGFMCSMFLVVEQGGGGLSMSSYNFGSPFNLDSPVPVYFQSCNRWGKLEREKAGCAKTIKSLIYCGGAQKPIKIHDGDSGGHPRIEIDESIAMINHYRNFCPFPHYPVLDPDILFQHPQPLDFSEIGRPFTPRMCTTESH